MLHIWVVTMLVFTWLKVGERGVQGIWKLILEIVQFILEERSGRTTFFLTSLQLVVYAPCFCIDFSFFKRSVCTIYYHYDNEV